MKFHVPIDLCSVILNKMILGRGFHEIKEHLPIIKVFIMGNPESKNSFDDRVLDHGFFITTQYDEVHKEGQ